MISVVVPVRSGAAYLHRSLESIRQQSYSGLEVIVVDNGSTDGSQEIVAGIAERDARFKILHSDSSGGAGAARNAGLAAAVGDYIVFWDCDDEFDPDMLERLHRTAIAENSDVVICAARAKEPGSNHGKRFAATLSAEQLNGRKTFRPIELQDDLFLLTNPAPWNKLFKTQFVKDRGLRFQEIRRANDLAFTYTAIASADLVSVVDAELMTYYLHNPGGLTTKHVGSEWYFLDALDALARNLRRAGLHERYANAVKTLVVRQCLYHLFASYDEAFDGDLLHVVRNEVFPRYGIRMSLRFARDLKRSQGRLLVVLLAVLLCASPRDFRCFRQVVRKFRSRTRGRG